MDNIANIIWKIAFYILIFTIVLQLKTVNENLKDIGNSVAAISKEVRQSDNAY